ncbi:MAG: hypothetical protein K6A35_06270 [bacterium]|jgi:type III secretion system FlhB-like substrate exporter|nr:hypothetical protein [bacterium]
MSKPESVSELKSAKVAVSVAYSEDGTTKVLASAVGDKAEAMIARAEEEGVEVVKDSQKVGELLEEQGNEAVIAPRLYELMAAVIDFSQELSDLKAGRFS